jgi:hypothetical protein
MTIESQASLVDTFQGKPRVFVLTDIGNGFSALEELSKLVKAGQPAYGMAAVGQGKISPGAQLLIEAADRRDSRPLYIIIWGGAILWLRLYGRFERNAPLKK